MTSAFRSILGVSMILGFAVVACDGGDGDDNTGGSGGGGVVPGAGGGGVVPGAGGSPTTGGTTISSWDGGYITHFTGFNVAGPVYTYEWAGATCTLSPANGEEVTDSSNVTVSGCTGGDYPGGGFAFAFCAAPGETWAELEAAIPSMATWTPQSKHTWAECNPGKKLVSVSIPGLPACAEIEYQDATDKVVTDLNTAVSVNVKVDGVKGCSVENLDLSYVFNVQ